MKYYSKILTSFVISSSVLSLTRLPAHAMEEQKRENAKRTPRASRSTPRQPESLPIPQSFHLAAEFEGISITPNHVLNRHLLLDSSLGNHAEEKRKELTRKGVEYFSKNELPKARSCFERAALYGDTAAMGQLGKLCENDQLQALQWYILAFQIKWLETGEHYPFATNSIKKLPTEEAKAFIKTVSEFYPLKRKNKDIFEKLYQAYNNRSYEPYLTEEERSVKEAAFKPEEVAWKFDEGLIGQVFPEEIRTKKAAQLYWYSRNKNLELLYNVGVMLSQERLLPQNLQEIGIPNICKSKAPLTPLAWAARFYAESGNSASLVNLGNMLSDGRLTMSELQKTGALHFLNIKRATHLTNYQLAAWLYKKSEHQSVFVNLGNMLSHQQITLKDLEEIGVIKLLNIKNKRNLDLNTVRGYLYAHSKTHEGLYNLGQMLRKEKITPQELQEMGANELLGIENVTSLSPAQLQALFYVKSGIPMALGELGLMLKGRHISPQQLQEAGANTLLRIQDISSFSHSELAAFFFITAEIPETSHNLGIMLHEKQITPLYLQEIGANKLLGIHDITSFTDSELVALLLSQVEGPKTFYNLGVMFREKQITPLQLQNIGLMQRFKIPEETLHTNFEWAAFFFEKAGTSFAFNNLGILYANGSVGMQLPEEERLKKAENYFIASELDKDKYNLAYMYITDQAGTDYDPVTRHQKAIDLLEFVRLRGFEDQELLNDAKKLLKFEQTLQNLLNELEHTVGKQEGEKADYSPSKKIIPLQPAHKEPSDPKDLPQEMCPDHSQPELSPPPMETLDTPHKEYVKRKKKPIIIKKKIEVLKEEIKKRIKPQQTPSFFTSEKDKPKDFTVEFLTPKARKNFYALLGDEKSPSPRKIKELIHNIFNQPIGSKGLGRPKPLKGKLKGLWERRINGKDRLIYQIQLGKIIIHSFEGHL
jgi:toxin YoeB